MKRKTNLFYTSGSDSNFLVFSNYTESMTGNFLATNIKLFPSKFLCLYIKDLIDNREEFIKTLVAAYENKLAVLRDYCVENNYNVEEYIKPLGYLLDIIKRFDPNYKINFIGQVAEQDYNGIYSDTICVIDSSSSNYGEVSLNSNYLGSGITIESNKYLYGWSDNNNYIGPDEYEHVEPIYDILNGYLFNSHSDIITKIDTIENRKDIKFNCVIPLYDIINVNHTQNLDEITNLEEINCNGPHAYVTNVPLGIWFANEDKVLTRAGSKNYAPSWSLVLSSQFKPFPYSASKVSEIDQSDRMDAFSTFAQILVRQNKMLDKIGSINTLLGGINERLTNLETNINNADAPYNVNNLRDELNNLRKEMSRRMKELEDETCRCDGNNPGNDNDEPVKDEELYNQVKEIEEKTEDLTKWKESFPMDDEIYGINNQEPYKLEPQIKPEFEYIK